MYYMSHRDLKNSLFNKDIVWSTISGKLKKRTGHEIQITTVLKLMKEIVNGSCTRQLPINL